MTTEERLERLEQLLEILMDDPAVRHKIAVAKLQAGRNKNPLMFEIKPNYA